ncbi:hypothetical protein, partial [Escherichia coli]|uniref:hypothetical protein n=1 Tax=Escherichia coli TaxID=562 RepID=UPI0039DF3917
DADAVLAGTGPGHRLRDSAVAAFRGLPVLRAACCYLLIPTVPPCEKLRKRFAKTKLCCNGNLIFPVFLRRQIEDARH